jgi:oligopeptide transport system substrate-binding protein
MRRSRWIAGVAMPLAAALALAGCGSSSSNNSSGGGGGADQQAKNDAAEITLHSSEPQNPLIPGNTNEEGGAKVVDEMWTGLVINDPVTNEVTNANAEKLDLAPDATSLTVTLKKGWKFHDGTEVKAKNYVDAWNYVVFGPNGQLGASFFEGIKGYKEVSDEKSTVKAMSGLQVVDDNTFKVTFDGPHAIFPLKLGYHVFVPMPDSFFKDPKAFEQNPIGNGPYKFVARVPKQSISLERFEGYGGTDKGHIKKVKYLFPESLDASYAQVKSNQLDFLEQVPISAIVGNLWKTDFKDRSGKGDVLAIQIINFPLYDAKYKNADLRKAISMAIDRDAINKKLYEGNRKPVKGFAVPKTPGWEDGACEACVFNPDKAKEAFAKSGYTGKIEITSNADGGHKEWIEAACGSIKNTIGLDCQFVPVQTFGEVRKKITAHTMTQMYRGGWIADYPSIENFLNPLYRTGGSSNDGLYSNPAVDSKLAEADGATTVDGANKLYREAEKMLAQEMPAIPLWATPRLFVYSNKIKNVRMTPKGQLDLGFVDMA